MGAFGGVTRRACRAWPGAAPLHRRDRRQTTRAPSSPLGHVQRRRQERLQVPRIERASVAASTRSAIPLARFVRLRVELPRRQPPVGAIAQGQDRAARAMRLCTPAPSRRGGALFPAPSASSPARGVLGAPHGLEVAQPPAEVAWRALRRSRPPAPASPSSADGRMSISCTSWLGSCHTRSSSSVWNRRSSSSTATGHGPQHPCVEPAHRATDPHRALPTAGVPRAR